jgi:SHAQKYF class myb-like DNA-binding protein
MRRLSRDQELIACACRLLTALAVCRQEQLLKQNKSSSASKTSCQGPAEMVETNDINNSSEPEPTGRSGEEPRFCGVLEDIKQAKGIKRKLEDQGDAAGADPKDCAATGDSATSSQLQETEGPRRVQKKQRLVWSADLHARFMQAVNTLGIERAVPKTILQVRSRFGCLSHESFPSQLLLTNVVYFCADYERGRHDA